MSRNRLKLRHEFWTLLIEIKQILQTIRFLLKYIPNSSQFDYYSCRIRAKKGLPCSHGDISCISSDIFLTKWLEINNEQKSPEFCACILNAFNRYRKFPASQLISTRFDLYSCSIFEKQVLLVPMVTFHAYQPIFSYWSDKKSIMSRNHLNFIHVFWPLSIEIKHLLKANWILLI